MKTLPSLQLHSTTSQPILPERSTSSKKICLGFSPSGASIAKYLRTAKNKPTQIHNSEKIINEQSPKNGSLAKNTVLGTKLTADMRFLIQQQQQTKKQLNLAKSELAELSQENKTSPSPIDVALVSLKLLQQEKNRPVDSKQQSRVYNEVLDEETAIQTESFTLNLHDDIKSRKNSIKDQLSYMIFKEKAIFEENNSSKNAFKDNKYQQYINDYNDRTLVYLSKQGELDILRAQERSIKNNVITGNIHTPFSPLVEKSGEIQFLTKKLALLEYSSKVTSLYQQGSWTPSTAAIESINRQGNKQSEEVICSTNEIAKNLIQAEQLMDFTSREKYLSENIHRLEKLLKNNIRDKKSIKYCPTTSLAYLYSKHVGKDSYNKKIKSTSQDLDTCKELRSEVDISKKKAEDAVYTSLANSLYAQQKLGSSYEEKLLAQLAYNHQKPTVSSRRGIDPMSGLYHEIQFEKSGTCILHATNHYLSAYAMQNELPYLELTPKRLDLLLHGIYLQQQAKISENLLSELQRPHPTDIRNIAIILKSMDRGLTALKDKYLQQGEHNAVAYNYQDSGPTATDTGDFYSKGIMNLTVSNISPLKKMTKVIDTAEAWAQKKDMLIHLQNNHDQLAFGYLKKREGGHAMNFAKVKGQWYFQDSHFDAPIRCSPIEMIAHINNQDHHDGPLNYCPSSGVFVSFREHHKLNNQASIDFAHYTLSPNIH